MSGECPKCEKHLRLTKHHVFPKRHFRKEVYLFICRDCHTRLEKLIPQRKAHVRFYLYVLIVFGIKKEVVQNLSEEKKIRKMCNNLPDHVDFQDYRTYVRELRYKGKPRTRKRNHRRKQPARFFARRAA